MLLFRFVVFSTITVFIGKSVACAQKLVTEIGVQGGAYLYQGDLTSQPLGSFKTVRPGAGIWVGTNISNAFGVRMAFALAGLRGDDTKYGPEYRTHRAFKFTSRVKELSLQGVYRFNANKENVKWQPYVLAGAGVSFQKPNRDYSQFNQAYFGELEDIAGRLAQDVDYSMPKAILVVPIGFGMRYNLSEKFALDAEVNYRLTRSDYIDGYSIAANPDRNDHYTSATLGVVYKLGKREKEMGCPTNVY